MDSAFIHQAANELVQTAGTRNIKQIARSCGLDISETSRIKDMLGLLSLYFDKPLPDAKGGFVNARFMDDRAFINPFFLHNPEHKAGISLQGSGRFDHLSFYSRW